MHKWLVIAKNEYRLRTAKFPHLRLFLPILIAAFLALYIFLFAPMIFGVFTDDFTEFFFSNAAVASIELILFTFFIIFLIFPITYALQQPQVAQQEILLSAPISTKDLLLGKFAGDMLFYSIGIVLLAGSFTAILNPFGLSAIQIIIIIAIFVITFLSAFWIGTVIATLLRTALGRTARGRDIGKALAMIIALPLVALMYGVMSGSMLKYIGDPDAPYAIKLVLSALPSSWGSDIVVSFATSPSDMSGLWVDTLLRISAISLFLFAVLWLGARAANRAYSLEPTSLSVGMAKPEGTFYRVVRFIGGRGSFGTLLSSIFKDYGRRLENISKIVYMIGLIFLVRIFFGSYGEDELDIFGVLILPAGILPFLAVFIMGEVTIRGKESLFIFRKAPGGEGRLIRARMIQGLIFVLPITAILVSLMLISVPGISIITIAQYTGAMTLMMTAYVAFALGLILIMPVYTDKPAELMLNVMIVMFVAMGAFIGSLIVFGEPWGLLSALVISWIFGLTFLLFGIRNLKSLE